MSVGNIVYEMIMIIIMIITMFLQRKKPCIEEEDERGWYCLRETTAVIQPRHCTLRCWPNLILIWSYSYTSCPYTPNVNIVHMYFLCMIIYDQGGNSATALLVTQPHTQTSSTNWLLLICPQYLFGCKVVKMYYWVYQTFCMSSIYLLLAITMISASFFLLGLDFFNDWCILAIMPLRMQHPENRQI